MANQPTTKMLICSWKGCEEFVFADTAAFHEHMVKHGQEQMQPPKTEAEGNGRRKAIFMAIEVWVDVFGFIKRIQLARTISLTSRLIHQICWPRLHGNKVEARRAREIIIKSRIESEGRPPTALMQLSDGYGTEIPLASWPLPEYISGFSQFEIKYLDQEVVELLTHIFPCINNEIIMTFNLKELDEEHCAIVGQLLNCFGKGLLTGFYVHIDSPIMVDRIKMLHEIDKAGPIYFCIKDKSGIPIVMKILETPTANGQQRVMYIHFYSVFGLSAQELLYAIKKGFRASTQPFPQPFYIGFWMDGNVEIDEENQQTDEILRSFNVTINKWVICRHPKGQHEQFVEDGRKRLNSMLVMEGFKRLTYVMMEF